MNKSKHTSFNFGYLTRTITNYCKTERTTIATVILATGLIECNLETMKNLNKTHNFNFKNSKTYLNMFELIRAG